MTRGKGLNKVEIKVIRSEFVDGGLKRNIAKRHGISPQTVKKYVRDLEND